MASGTMLRKLTMLGAIALSISLTLPSFIGLPGCCFQDTTETRMGDPALNDLNNLIEAGSFKNAREKLRALIVEKPDDVYVRLLAGRLYRKMGLWSLSLVEYERARRLDPHLVEPYIALSQMHLENLSVEIALAMAREAVLLAPDSLQAHQALISALIANHNLRDADNELAQLLNASPHDPDVLYLSYKINREKGDLQ